MSEDREVLAGELALEVLDGAERADALRLLVADPAFARAVARWRERFAAWFAEWPEVEPDAGLEARVMAATPGASDGLAPAGRAGASDGLVPAGRAGASDGLAPAGRHALRLWRGLAGAAAAIAAALLAALLLQPERVVRVPAPAPAAAVAPAPLVAVLTPTGRGRPVAALVDRQAGAVALAVGLEVPRGRAAELWTIGADGTPRSVGVLGGGTAPRVTARADARGRLAAGVTLAVSIEPPGGSPTGSPTGPVVATGALVEVAATGARG